jgi:hypothetical protein
MSWYIINHCVHPFILVHVSSGWPILGKFFIHCPLNCYYCSCLLFNDSEYEVVGGMRIGRGNRSTWGKPTPAHFVHKSYMTWPGIKLKLATNHLSCGMPCYYCTFANVYYMNLYVNKCCIDMEFTFCCCGILSVG